MKTGFAVAAIALMAAGGFRATAGAREIDRIGRAQEAAAARSVRDGVYTDEQAKRGDALYRQECGTCHGDALTGGEASPALTGPDFLANWNGLTVGDLMEKLRLTMPDGAPGKMSRQEYADLLAFILKVNGFPAGTVELAKEPEPLKQIKVELPKP
jgi:mono/diheme cytochrome c family protein